LKEFLERPVIRHVLYAIFDRIISLHKFPLDGLKWGSAKIELPTALFTPLAYGCKCTFNCYTAVPRSIFPVQEVHELSRTGNKNGGRPVLIVDGRSGKNRKSDCKKQNKLASFEEAVLPHLDAAYNLARWLTRNVADAEDVVQEAYLRRSSSLAVSMRADGRSWLLPLWRNTC